MLYSRTLLSIHPMYNSLHLLTPKSHSMTPTPFLSLGNHKSVLYVCESVSVLEINAFVSHFRLHM